MKTIHLETPVRINMRQLPPPEFRAALATGETTISVQGTFEVHFTDAALLDRFYRRQARREKVLRGRIAQLLKDQTP